jgi:hypothetical protein
MTTQTMTNSQTEGTNAGPVDRFIYGPVHVTIWENHDRNGNSFYSVRIERRYKKSEAEGWDSSNSFTKEQLPVVADLVGRAYTRLSELNMEALAGAR